MHKLTAGLFIFPLAGVLCLSGCAALEDNPEWVEFVNGPRNPYIHQLHPVTLDSDYPLEAGKEYSANDVFVIDVEEEKVTTRLAVFWKGQVDDNSAGITVDNEKETFMIEEGTGEIVVIYAVSTPVVSYDDTCSAYFTVVEGEQ